MRDLVIRQYIERLHRERTLAPDEFRILLTEYHTGTLAYINELARSVAREHFGNRVYLRGLIEITNSCHNDCYYCGIRRGNKCIERYSLSAEQILACCEEGYRLGFRTFVLQGGETGGHTDEFIIDTVARIRSRFPDAAITLSLGEKSTETYRQYFLAGANRYLLRHETHNAAHYRQLHPESMSLDNRLRCLKNLKEIGFQTGTGIMVGSPGQTVEHLIEDLLYIQQLQPQMIGIGPFLPHKDTPFGNCPPGSLELTLLLLSIFRLMHPQALIPSTTALATLSPDGRERGILAGANVVMPNLSPADLRSQYALYNNKASMGAEAAEGIRLLSQRLEAIGYTIDMSRGDYPGTPA